MVSKSRKEKQQKDMAETKLHRLSSVSVKSVAEADSIKRRKRMMSDDRARGQQILLEAQGYYQSGYRFRRDRDRNKRYTYGDQLGDIITVDGEKMTEEFSDHVLNIALNYGGRQELLDAFNKIIKSIVTNYQFEC